MAQGERSTAAGGEAGDTWKEEYGSDAAESAPDLLRTVAGTSEITTH